MELIMALVCERAVTTKDGKLDLHGVFNDLFAPGFPACPICNRNFPARENLSTCASSGGRGAASAPRPRAPAVSVTPAAAIQTLP